MARLNRNPSTGAIAAARGHPGCVSQGIGSCAAGHGLDTPYFGGGEPGREERLRSTYGSNAVARLDRNPTTRAIAQPAGAAGCVERGPGRRRPAPPATGSLAPASVAVSPDGKSVYVASGWQHVQRRPSAATAGRPWRASTATRPRGRSPSPPGPTGCVSEDRVGALRRRPRARRPGLGRGEPRTGRASTSPPTSRWRASTATRPPGRSPSPPAAAGCVSQTGAGPCADGHGLVRPRSSVAVSPGREERLRRLGGRQRRRGALQPQPDHRGDRHSPPGPPAASARTGAGPCADGHALDGPGSVAVSPRREERLRRLPRQPRRGPPQPQPDHRGDRHSPPGPPAASARTGSGPCADGHALVLPPIGGGEPGREERVHRHGPRRRGALRSGPLEPFRADQRMLTAAEAPTAARTIE